MQHLPLQITDFDESECEIQERQMLESKLFVSTVQSHVISSDGSDTCVGDVRRFLDCDARNLHADQPSLVHYLELVDENPDSDETMTIIAEDLLYR